MRKVHGLVVGLLVSGFIGVSASAQTILFQDGFEADAVSAPDGSPATPPPPIGISWTEGPSSGAHGIDIVASPAIGTRSMRVLREGVPPLGPSNGRADGLSLAGAIVPGNIVEVKWSFQLTDEGPTTHAGNGPMQMSIGHAGSNYSNDLAFILLNDAGPNLGVVHYSNSTTQYAGSTNTSVLSSRPADRQWDTLRAVMSIAQINATTMGGTYDLYASIAGGAEQQLANDALLFNTVIPVADPTNMQLRIGRGPSGAFIYYDDISVTVVPEPSLAGLGAAGVGLLAVRRRIRR